MLILKTIFMIVLTVIMYIGAKKLQQRYKSPFLNPALISSIGIIIVLLLSNEGYQDYMVGGQWINYLLNCTVVCLAFPLYQNRQKIMAHLKIIVSSVLAAVLLNFIFVYSILKLFGYSKEVIVTMLPRSMTAAVGIEVSHQLGGIDTITVMFIVATGLIGSIVGSYLLRFGRFETSIAKGLTYGNASHAFGTAKALEMDLESGAFSSIGMILTAVMSSVLLPILILFLY
ncbi:LrgB family protein [Staphylococcus gallinarum]|jgi:predicted murein hydrolase (TIGR00659 family)|uniref:Holin-like protein CidB n=1 Tax=Staphylococcus gallinarum TaxID=1293 RepID=A0A0D0RJG1_STAGA|nr:LrgB family protein [Staphylococcus gallinarum]KIR10067.1 holin [Staphylococcus gallinarum]MBU7217750.1 LrgB family protein [Staphylococcus gallinarum]MCD8785252.1 LrgB family protein [Staphylococcus gallinarum]MCD8792473.1 LrgB family protein [Staphylococcus gallinarum]MCD8821957.1 LrgB family protein [Staphylococcus gallinarum]